MKPSIISLHYTSKCERNCPHCYLKKQISIDKEEISKDEWLKLPKLVDSYIKKIAIAVNYYPSFSTSIIEESEFALKFFKNCNISNIAVDITTDKSVAQYMLLSKLSDNINYVDVFSISVDNNKMEKSDINYLSYLVNNIKLKGASSVNANFLLTSECIKWINDGILEVLSKIFDTVHIIFEKPFTYSRDEFYNIIEQLYSHDTFENDKYIIDPCILFRLGLVDHCHNTNHIIDINPYGSVSGCAYDHVDMEIDKIKNISDINKILNNNEEKNITRCKYLEFKDNYEINETKFRESNSD
jgi:hypothetical protein